MLDEYYEIVGWDKETGAPKDSRLKDLGDREILTTTSNHTTV